MICLKGKLEKVRIIEQCSERCSLGYVNFNDKNETEVIVSDSIKYLDKDILARFNNYTKHGNILPLGNFISSQVPKDFESFYSDEFILLGKWKLEWNIPDNNNFYLPLSHVNNYYEPGKMGSALFFKNNGDNNLVYQLFPNSYDELDNSQDIEFLIHEHLPSPESHPRVILCDSQDYIKIIKKDIRNLELEPVEMEPLTTKSFLSHRRY